jgi:hypothetical protein
MIWPPKLPFLHVVALIQFIKFSQAQFFIPFAVLQCCWYETTCSFNAQSHKYRLYISCSTTIRNYQHNFNKSTASEFYIIIVIVIIIIIKFTNILFC